MLLHANAKLGLAGRFALLGWASCTRSPAMAMARRKRRRGTYRRRFSRLGEGSGMTPEEH